VEGVSLESSGNNAKTTMNMKSRNIMLLDPGADINQFFHKITF